MEDRFFGRTSFSMDELNDIACSGKAMKYDNAIILIHASDFIGLYEPDECLRKAIDILENKQRTPDEEYLLGYAWYNLSEDKVDPVVRNEAVEYHLNKSLDCDESFRNYLYAKELLGCQYYDVGKYEKSFSLLSGFENDCFLKSYHQGWRDVKIAELKLSCILRLGRVSEIRGCVETLYKVIVMVMQRDDTLKGGYNDLEDPFADPTELIKTLEDISATLKNHD
jgi:hypothetical protein